MKELMCADCGKSFLGKSAYFCPDCRKNRKARNAVAMRAGLAKKRENETVRIERKLSVLKSSRVKEPFVPQESCPNYDGASISCVTCPAGAWKFKACGRSK